MTRKSLSGSPSSGAGGAAVPFKPDRRVAAYLDEIAEACENSRGLAVSVVLFGSAATGDYDRRASDVDLLVVVDDAAGSDEKRRLRDAVGAIEADHGLAKARPGAARQPGRFLQGIADRMRATVRAHFVCTRADLLSGDPGLILGLPGWLRTFVDRAAVPCIAASARTVWGEDLLPLMRFPPIRRFDVVKALYVLLNQFLFVVAAYPLLPGATSYAMDTLKLSLHSCYYCYHGRRAPLADEAEFFRERIGAAPALGELLKLRQAYRASPRFVAACLPLLFRLHLRTARELRFPRAAGPDSTDQAGLLSPVSAPSR